MSNRKTAPLILACFICLIASLGSVRAADPIDGPALSSSVRRTLGSMRGSYFAENGLVSDQIMMGMSAAYSTKQLADGNYFISGCRFHDCPEKSALIVTPSRAMVAAGLIASSCYHRPVPDDCAQDWTLTFLVKQSNNRPAVLQILRDWAESILAEDRKAYGARNVQNIRRTETRIIPESLTKATH